MKYGDLTLGQMEAIVNKLGGMDGVLRFLSGATMVSVARKVFSTCFTLKLKVFKTVGNLMKEVDDSGAKITADAKSVMNREAFKEAFKLLAAGSTEREFDLVKVTVGEMGFSHNPTLEEMGEWGKTVDLLLCPAETAPQLRAQHKGTEFLWVYMEPIVSDSDGDPKVLCLGSSDGDLWLLARCVNPARVWYGDNVILFRRARK